MHVSKKVNQDQYHAFCEALVDQNPLRLRAFEVVSALNTG